MSYVTNLILLHNQNEYDDGGKIYPPIEQINDMITARLSQQGFTDVGEHTNGHKYMEARVWCIALNGFGVSDVLAIIRATRWDFPKDVLLIAKDQDQEAWTVIDVFKESTELP